jgi:hypothetical protein
LIGLAILILIVPEEALMPHLPMSKSLRMSDAGA